MHPKMIEKYEAQQKENDVIRDNSYRGVSSSSLKLTEVGAFLLIQRDRISQLLLHWAPTSVLQRDSLLDALATRATGTHSAPTFLEPSSLNNISTRFLPQPAEYGVGWSPSSHIIKHCLGLCDSSQAIGHEQLDQRISQVLEELKLSKYGPTLAREEISYDAFLLLESEDLIQMGMPIGPRKLILSKILKLQQQG